MRLRGTARAWAELGRVSNLPTIVSNVVVGPAAAAAAMPGSRIEWKDAAVAGAGVAILYLAGMVLNDVIDVTLDRRERPSRPIPSGRVSRRAAMVACGVLMAAGVGLTGVNGASLRFGLVLAGLIIAYDVVHHVWSPSVLLMGACRGMVYVVTAVAGLGTVEAARHALLPALAVGVHTVLLSIVARGEASEQSSRARWLAFLIPILPIVVVQPRGAEGLMWSVVAGVAMAAWLLAAARHLFDRRPNPRAAVMAYLAGFCLIDTYLVAVYGRPTLMLVTVACFAAVVLGHRRILGT